TFANASGLRVRALLGSKTMPWTTITGLSVDTRSVYAVQADGAVRLPCVRVADLGNLSFASDGRLPEISQPTLKFAPARRRGR
ncbi:MAG: PH domain-containing protein, partial [Jatrophihabitantaceae bacterium]